MDITKHSKNEIQIILDAYVYAFEQSFAESVQGGLGLRVQSSEFRVQGSGFRVQSSEFRVQGLGFWVLGWGLESLHVLSG